MSRWVVVALVATLSCRTQVDSGKAAPKKSSVHVPLPADWRVQVAEGENFRAGPPGHPVLRIDSSRSTSPIPSVRELADRFQKQDRTIAVRLVDSIEKPETAVGVFQLGRDRRPLDAMLGVRRVQGQTFLCSTVPGASAADVRSAAQACASLTIGDATATPRP